MCYALSITDQKPVCDFMSVNLTYYTVLFSRYHELLTGRKEKDGDVDGLTHALNRY